MYNGTETTIWRIPMKENMGQIIKRLRKERNLTQEELAEQLNISAQAISKWENGTSMPDISQVVPLANYFGVSTDTLFSRESKNDDAVKSLVQAVENDTEYNYNIRFEKLKVLLSEYPADLIILDAIVRCGTFLITPQQINSQVFLDTIHSAELYIRNAKKLGDIVRMYAKKIDVYARAGRYAEAEDVAKELQMPIISSEMYLAHISEKRGNYTEEIRHEQESIALLLGYIAGELERLAVAYRNNGELEKAIEVNLVNMNLTYVFHQEGAFHAPLFNWHSIAGFEAAFDLVALERYDEAIELLEKIFDYGEIQCKHCSNYSQIESPVLNNIDLTLFHGELKPSDYLWKITRPEFDPLHKYERFQRLLERYKEYS